MKKNARSEEISDSSLSDIAGSTKIAEIAQKIAPKKPKAADIPPPLQSAEESAENLRSKIEARAGRTSLKKMWDEWVARYYPTAEEMDFLTSPTNGFGKTPLEAVKKLEESMNWKREQNR